MGTLVRYGKQMAGNSHRERDIREVKLTGFIQLKSSDSEIRQCTYKTQTAINCSENAPQSDGRGFGSQDDG